MTSSFSRQVLEWAVCECDWFDRDHSEYLISGFVGQQQCRSVDDFVKAGLDYFDVLDDQIDAEIQSVKDVNNHSKQRIIEQLNECRHIAKCADREEFRRLLIADWCERSLDEVPA